MAESTIKRGDIVVLARYTGALTANTGIKVSSERNFLNAKSLTLMTQATQTGTANGHFLVSTIDGSLYYYPDVSSGASDIQIKAVF